MWQIFTENVPGENRLRGTDGSTVENGFGVAHRTAWRQGCDGIRPLKRQGIMGTRQGLLCEEQMKRSGNAVDSPSGNRGRFFVLGDKILYKRRAGTGVSPYLASFFEYKTFLSSFGRLYKDFTGTA